MGIMQWNDGNPETTAYMRKINQNSTVLIRYHRRFVQSWNDIRPGVLNENFDSCTSETRVFIYFCANAWFRLLNVFGSLIRKYSLLLLLCHGCVCVRLNVCRVQFHVWIYQPSKNSALLPLAFNSQRHFHWWSLWCIYWYHMRIWQTHAHSTHILIVTSDTTYNIPMRKSKAVFPSVGRKVSNMRDEDQATKLHPNSIYISGAVSFVEGNNPKHTTRWRWECEKNGELMLVIGGAGCGWDEENWSIGKKTRKIDGKASLPERSIRN